MFAGMTEAEFDQLCTEVQKKFPDTEKKRLSRPDRVRDIGAGRPFALDLRNRVLLVLFYYRTYVSQDVAGAMFGIGQASVSRSISLTEPLLKQCLPIPEKIYKDSKRISSVEELAEIFPGMVCLTDASEQPTNRPKRKDMEKSHYSGKAGTHTAKVVTARALEVQARILPSKKADQTEFVPEIVNHFRSPSCYPRSSIRSTYTG